MNNRLGDKLRRSLLDFGFITIHDLGVVRCGIVTFTVHGMDSADVKAALAEYKVNVDVSLGEYSRLDLSERNLAHLVRASVHYYNTEEEIERFCQLLRSIYDRRGRCPFPFHECLGRI